jgi:hypothetical protein
MLIATTSAEQIPALGATPTFLNMGENLMGVLAILYKVPPG